MTVERGNGWEMHLGDCLDVMPTLGRFDAVVTDPPYGVSFKGAEWDARVPSEWLDVARRIASVIVFTTAPTTMWDYPRPDWVCIAHRQAARSRAVSGGFNHWTPILVYGRVKFPIDVVTFVQAAEASGPEIEHPSPKQLVLMEWMVRGASRDLACVLDPFAGSGTTGVACLRLGRKFVGIEKDPGYFKLACDRLRAEEQNSTLAAARAGQEALFK